MSMTSREFWTALHGLLLGGVFLLAFTGGFVGLWGLRADAGARASRWLVSWTWTMAVLAWLTVLVGTFVVYPWYRAKPPAGADRSALAGYPRSQLLSSPRTADWHEFGMEWKEHVAWFAPILSTCVAFVVTRHRAAIAADGRLRRAMLALYGLSFAAAMVAGLLGALIDKAAPVR
jgi:hypothetical protein